MNDRNNITKLRFRLCYNGARFLSKPKKVENDVVKSLGQVMLYVRDLDASAKFWKEQAGFERVEKLPSPDGAYVYLVAPLQSSEVAMILQDKTKVEKMNPELHLGTPSILMSSEDLEKTYQQFIERGVKANPIMEFGTFKFFNFPDNENNYFAIQEVKEEKI